MNKNGTRKNLLYVMFKLSVRVSLSYCVTLRVSANNNRMCIWNEQMNKPEEESVSMNAVKWANANANRMHEIR